MRLTALKLAGFKSFVDSTTLPLPTNLTAVVGPNGSGKSNLIDAVRWVLGESSSKALRGADSQDVIFNGAKSRKPGGRASVELLFDNSDQTVQGEWGRYNEIAVRREVIRGGTAQYFINGQRCLKRDVVDLFLGTGLGGRNQYAILEQGTVAQLVEAKPDELRRWLEEAAGISRYKERRRETESRIRQTRDNLARLGDLQSEIDKRLKVLTRQAADAERFNQSKAQERRLRAELLLLRRQNVERESAQRKARIEDAIGELEQARTLLSERDSARQMAESARNRAGETFNAAQAEMYQAEAVRSRSEQSLAHAREMQAVHEREVEASEARLAQLGERIEREKAQTVELEKELANVQSEGVAASSNEQQAAASLATAEAALAEEQRLWEGFEQRAQTPILEAERERSNVQASEKAAEGLAARLQRLDEERAALDEKPLQAALFDSDSELEALEAEIAQVRVRLDDGDTRLQALRGERDSNESTLNEARDALQDVRGRCASLETLQQAALRSDDQALAQWLDARGWQQRPRLADQLRVGGGWETAVEHVLSGLLQAPVLESWRPADMPPTGPASGVATVAGGSSGDAPPAASLASHVQGPAVVREWLDSVQVADSDSEALATLEKLEPGASVITADGVWRGRGWVRYPCADAADSGVIARGKLLREVQIRRE
ncbi:MAG: AAA family ATPase, partial [Sinobacteraceae bacterium]|nr:AAA family ATPase [Nevskiaceae bacterium]